MDVGFQEYNYAVYWVLIIDELQILLDLIFQIVSRDKK
jgi:hypothetical protein